MSQQENAIKAQVFSNRLIGARNLRMLSQAELAEKLGISLRSVQNWEGGSFVPHGKTLRRICEVLEVSAAYLFGDEPTAPSGAPAFLREEASPPVAARCVIHLQRFLETCGNDESRLGWTEIELREHFPLDKWKRDVIVHEPGRQTNSAYTSSDEEKVRAVAEAARGIARGGSGESERRSGVGEHTSRKDRPRSASHDPTRLPRPGREEPEKK